MKCKICNFDRYVEKCHIIPKYLYGNDDLDNLIYLCPNHHKLLDAGLLNTEEIAFLEKRIVVLLNKTHGNQYNYLLYLLKLKEKPA